MDPYAKNIKCHNVLVRTVLTDVMCYSEHGWQTQ